MLLRRSDRGYRSVARELNEQSCKGSSLSKRNGNRHEIQRGQRLTTISAAQTLADETSVTAAETVEKRRILASFRALGGDPKRLSLAMTQGTPGSGRAIVGQ